MSADQSTTEYRESPLYPGYRFGSDGSFWTKRKRGNGGGKLYAEWRQMRPTRSNKHGHLGVQIFPSGEWRLAHRLILEIFVGPCPEGMEARHFPDPDPTNNAVANLSWAPHKVNMGDRVTHKTLCRGTRNHLAKLTDDLVRSIRADWDAGTVTQISLAKRYGVSQALISRIVRRETWKHVT